MDQYNSNDQVWLKFSDPKIALKYPLEFRNGHWRDELEKQCILKALKYFPRGAHLLDLPCGSGRLTKMLLTAGYKVTAADISIPMLKIAERNCLTYQSDFKALSQTLQFKTVNILDTGFNDKGFDGVICYRLFHHFMDADTRKRAMAELQRISHGPVLISFFNSFSMSALRRRIKSFIKGQPIKDRVAIKMSLFLDELRSQGLLPFEKIPLRWGISPQWNVIAMPNDTTQNLYPCCPIK